MLEFAGRRARTDGGPVSPLFPGSRGAAGFAIHVQSPSRQRVGFTGAGTNRWVPHLVEGSFMSSPRWSSSPCLIAAAAVTAAGLYAAAPARGVDIPLDNYSLEVQHRSSTGAYAASQAQPATGMRIGFQSGFGGPDSG